MLKPAKFCGSWKRTSLDRIKSSRVSFARVSTTRFIIDESSELFGNATLKVWENSPLNSKHRSKARLSIQPICLKQYWNARRSPESSTSRQSSHSKSFDSNRRSYLRANAWKVMHQTRFFVCRLESKEPLVWQARGSLRSLLPVFCDPFECWSS